MNEQIDSTGFSGRALDLLPGSPLPHLGDLGLTVVTRHCAKTRGALLEMATLPDASVLIGLYQFEGEGDEGAMLSMVAWSLSVRHMLAGAQPHSALDLVREHLAERFPQHTMFSGVLAVVDTHENRVVYACVGDPAPAVYRRAEGGPLQAADIRRASVRSMGARIDETRVHLMPGDWFILCSRGTRALVEERERSGGVVVPYRWLTSSTTERLAERIRQKADSLSQKGHLTDDVVLAALRVPPVSGRTRLLKELSFSADEPVSLVPYRYFEEMDAAAGGVLRAMDRLGYPDATIRKMKIVLAELLVNALEHGNKGDTSKRAILGYAVDGRRVKVSIMDEGDGFDPSRIPDPTVEPNLGRDRGRGLFMSRHFTDSMRHNASGTRVTIVKYFDAGETR